MSKLDKHLNADEKVLWNGKPVKAPFLFPALVIGLVLVLLWLIPGIMIGVYYTTRTTPTPYTPLMSTEAAVLVIWVIPAFGFFFVAAIWQFMRYRNTEYMITNQRIITQTGAIGLDTRFVDLDKIQEVYVKVGVIDKLFGTGSVIAVTAGRVHVGMMRPSLAALREPYEVQKLLQEAVQKTRRKAPKKD